MAYDIRLLLAVRGARARMREGMPAEQAAERLAYMVDVPAAQVLRLAVDAERGCAEARAHYQRVSCATEPVEEPDAP